LLENAIDLIFLIVDKMAYGFEINSILGIDFLIRAKAIINLPEMRIDFI